MPRENHSSKYTCTPKFIAALFTIARSWKQSSMTWLSKCPSTDKWIKKMWYICTMEYYSVIKRNEIWSFVEMWMDLEPNLEIFSLRRDSLCCTPETNTTL